MKNQLNRELIEGLNESNNQEFAERVNDLVYGLMGEVVNSISLKSPFVRMDKCVLIPVNEVYLGSFCQLSEYTYFLGVENTQIEFNSSLKKNWWKYIWREFRASWRLGRKKKYKKIKNKAQTVENVEKYKLSDLRHDVVSKLAENLSETSIVYEYPRYVSIIGKDDFGTGVKVNIFVCIYDSNTDTYKMFKENKNKFFSINFGKSYQNLENKKKECGQMFVNMVKIFNALYSKAYDRIPNQILIESLMFNCPKILFDKKDVYQTFVNVANYIRLKDPKSFVSVCDEAKNIFDEPLIVKSGSQLEFGKIINMLDRYKY